MTKVMPPRRLRLVRGRGTVILATPLAGARPLFDFVRRRPAWAIFLLAALMAFAFQGSRGLWDPDEGRYSNVALQMLKQGEYLTLYRHPESFHFTKPPLTYWAMAASVSALGRNEWAVRLPMALAFLASALMLLRLGRTFVPQRPWLPALIYLSAPLPFLAAYTVNTDTLLAACETLAVLCYVQARFAGASPRWLDGMWAAFGLAFLTKGPPGLLPLAAILVFHFSHRNGLRLWRPLGLLAFALIGFTWFALVVQKHPGLLQYFLGHEVVARIASEEMDRNPQWYGPLLVYMPTLLIGLLPWWPIALWRRRKTLRPGWAGKPVDTRFLCFWLLLPLIVFCLARSRLPLYILPLSAPLCLLLARALAEWRIGGAAVSLLAIWLLALLGFKAALAFDPPGDSELARGLRRNNAALVAAQLRPLLPGAPQEILFVEDKTRYGLNLYFDADIARIGFKQETKAISDAKYDMTVAASLRQTHGGRIYLVPRPQQGYFLDAAQAAGVQVVALGQLADERGRPEKHRLVYTLSGDFPPR